MLSYTPDTFADAWAQFEPVVLSWGLREECLPLLRDYLRLIIYASNLGTAVALRAVAEADTATFIEAVRTARAYGLNDEADGIEIVADAMKKLWEVREADLKAATGIDLKTAVAQLAEILRAGGVEVKIT